MQWLYFAQMYRDRYEPHMHGEYGIMDWYHPVLTLIILTLIVWGAIALFRYFKRSGGFDGSHRDPLEIARERYARGEITKEELSEIRKELKG